MQVVVVTIRRTRLGSRRGNWRVLVPLLLTLLLGACQSIPRREPDNDAPVSLERSDPVMMALAMIGTPYRFGGDRLGGFDCSGLTSYVFAQSQGLRLPHNAFDQSELGGRPLKINQLRSGDLVFFETSGNRISHVGLYVGEGRFVHAPSAGSLVRIDRIGDVYWGPRFRFGKRLLQ